MRRQFDLPAVLRGANPEGKADVHGRGKL